MISSIIFDFDGVIHDTWEIAYSVAQQVYPGVSEDEYRGFFNGNIYRAPQVTKDLTNKFFELQEPLYRKLIMAEEVKEIMIALQEEFPLDLVTSNRESIIRPYLERSSVPGLFRAILGEEMHESKHEKIEHLLQEYELQKEEVLFVTDTTGDIHEARLAGVESVAVTYGFHSRSWLEKEKPAWIIDDLCELRGIVGQSRGTYSK